MLVEVDNPLALRVIVLEGKGGGVEPRPGLVLPPLHVPCLPVQAGEVGIYDFAPNVQMKRPVIGLSARVDVDLKVLNRGPPSLVAHRVVKEGLRAVKTVATAGREFPLEGDSGTSRPKPAIED